MEFRVKSFEILALQVRPQTYSMQNNVEVCLLLKYNIDSSWIYTNKTS